MEKNQIAEALGACQKGGKYSLEIGIRLSSCKQILEEKTTDKETALKILAGLYNFISCEFQNVESFTPTEKTVNTFLKKQYTAGLQAHKDWLQNYTDQHGKEPSPQEKTKMEYILMGEKGIFVSPEFFTSCGDAQRQAFANQQNTGNQQVDEFNKIIYSVPAQTKNYVDSPLFELQQRKAELGLEDLFAKDQYQQARQQLKEELSVELTKLNTRHLADSTGYYSLLSSVCYLTTSYWTTNPLDVTSTLLSLVTAGLERLRSNNRSFSLAEDAPILLGTIGVRALASLISNATGISPTLAMFASEALIMGASAKISWDNSEAEKNIKLA